VASLSGYVGVAPVNDAESPFAVAVTAGASRSDYGLDETDSVAIRCSLVAHVESHLGRGAKCQ